MADPCDFVEDVAEASIGMSHKVSSFDSSSAIGGEANLYAIIALVVSAATVADVSHDAFASIIVETAALQASVVDHGQFSGFAIDAGIGGDETAQMLSDVMYDEALIATVTNVRLQDDSVSAAEVADLFQQIASAASTVSDRARCSDVVPPYIVNYTTSSATASDAVAHGAVVSVEVADSALGATALLQRASTSQVVVDMTLAMTARIDHNAAVSFVTEDGFGATVMYEPIGGAAWTALAQTWGMSRYVDMPFNSVAAANGLLLLAGEGGLFALAGDADDGAPIDAHLDTGVSAFNDKLKRPRYAYIGYTADGAMAIDFVGAPAGSPQTYSHSFDSRVAEWMTPNRVKLARVMRSGYYQIRLKNQMGCDFLVNDLRIIFDEASRRV